MSQNWVIKHEWDIKRFKASFPEYPENKQPIPTFLALTAGEKTEYFKSEIRQSARGTKIYVSKDAFKDVGDEFEASYYEINALSYYFSRTLRDEEQRLGFLGLILTGISISINTTLAIGKYFILFPFNNLWLGVFMLVSFVFQIIGAILIFGKGVVGAN
jgi:hypothetical protein